LLAQRTGKGDRRQRKRQSTRHSGALARRTLGLWSARRSRSSTHRGALARRTRPTRLQPAPARGALAAPFRAPAGEWQQRLSPAPFPRPRGMRAAPFHALGQPGPWSARQGRSGAHRRALARRTPGLRGSVEPRAHRWPTRSGSARGARARNRSSAHRGTPRASEARPARLGQPGPWSARQEPQRCSPAVEPLRCAASSGRHSRQELRSGAALRGEGGGDAASFNAPASRRSSPAGWAGATSRHHLATPPLPGGCPLTCSPPHMKG
jgi:hypothetical protein